MPVKIPDGLPAVQILAKENIFVMTDRRAVSQDIRPLRIAVLNLMPTKLATETQLLRVLGNNPLQIEVTLLHTATHKAKNIDENHLDAFYRTFDDVKDEQFDGLVITGAPVEKLDFEDVDYWPELVRILDWADKNVFSSFYICWAAQAALYHYYGIGKRPLPQKLFGVYPHRRLRYDHKLLRGFDDVFYVPHSRHTSLDESTLRACPELEVLAVSDEAGLYLAASRDGSRIFVTGHSEYDADTLALEYRRDLDAGLPIAPPANYYPQNDAAARPVVNWRAHGNMLYGNWLNYFVYQETPYDIKKVPSKRAGKQGKEEK
jgi:homoserine O-succinyltransferase